MYPVHVGSDTNESLGLQAVIRGQEQSRWLRAFLNAKRRRVVNPYLEDDQQLDQVYRYLNELYTTTVATSPCLAEVKQMEPVPFVLDVLLPEVSGKQRELFCMFAHRLLTFLFNISLCFDAGYHQRYCWGGQGFSEKGRRKVP